MKMPVDPLYSWRTPKISCEAVRRAARASGHCDSCHDDANQGYPMIEINTRKGVIEVCCQVANEVYPL